MKSTVNGTVPLAEELAKAARHKVELLIRPSGFFKVKAMRIQRISRELLEKHDGKVPDDIEEEVFEALDDRLDLKRMEFMKRYPLPGEKA